MQRCDCGCAGMFVSIDDRDRHQIRKESRLNEETRRVEEEEEVALEVELEDPPSGKIEASAEVEANGSESVPQIRHVSV